MTQWFLFLLSGLLWVAIILFLARRESALWRDVGAGGLLALFVCGFFWRTIGGDVYQPADGGDLVSFLFPTYRFAASTLASGAMPLWNPTLYAGAPFLHDIQAGFLYPPNLLLFLLRPAFSYAWMQWLSIGHLWWAGLGVYVLVRSLGYSRAGALLAGTAFALSDPLLIHLGNYNLIAVLSWLGWVLAGLHRTLRCGSLAWAGVTAGTLAVGTYAGHAQGSYYVGLALAGYALTWLAVEWTPRRLASERSGQRRTSRRVQVSSHPIVLLGVIALLGFLLVAPILLPAVELIPFTDRAAFAYQETVAFSLAPVPGLFGLLTPGFFGRGPALHWGLWDRVELPYAGVPTLLLAVGALLLPAAQKRRRLLPWILVASFGFVVALGIYAPVHGWLTQFLPGFGQFRAPARAVVLFVLGLCVLAAAGLDALLGSDRPALANQLLAARGARAGAAATLVPRPTGGYWTFLLVGGLFLGLLFLPASAASLLMLQPESIHFLRASLATLAAAWVVGGWLGTWVTVALFRRGAIGVNVVAGLLLTLLLLELAATGAYTDITEADPAAGFDHPAVVSFLQQEGRGRIDTRTGIEAIWQPDAAALYGLEDVGGVANPLALSHFTRFWESMGGRDTQMYDMLNVGHVVVEDGVPLPAGFTPVFDAPGPLTVYAHDDPLPGAWLVEDVTVAPSAEAALAALWQEGFDVRTGVVLLEARQEVGAAVLAPAAQGVGAASLPEVEALDSGSPNGRTYSVESPSPAVLVLSQIYFPGWRATVNDVAVPVWRANYAFQAVPVPAGASTVTLRFAPASWRWGLLLFALGMLGIAACSASARRSPPPTRTSLDHESVRRGRAG